MPRSIFDLISNKSNKTFLVLTCMALCSCGSLQRNKQTTTTSKPDLMSIAEQESRAAKKLEELVNSAKSKDEATVTYLSSDLFFKATDASLRGDSVTAAFLFKYLYDLNPQDTYVQRKYAIELIRNNDLEKAEPHLTEVFEKSKGDDEVAGLILGGVYTALEKNAEARGIYERLVKNSKGKTGEEACIFLAKSYAVDEKIESANRILTSCEKRYKDNGIFSYYKGKLALSQNKKKTAKAHFKKALKFDPLHEQSALALGLLKEEKEDYDSAIKIYKKFVRKRESSFHVLSRLVQLLTMKADQEDDEEAQAKLKIDVTGYAEKLSALDPSNLNLKVKLGLLYSDIGRLDDAIGTFKEILKAVPDSDRIIYYLGALYRETQNDQAAISLFSKIPESSNLFSESVIQIGEILKAAAVNGFSSNGSAEVERFENFIEASLDSSPDIRIELFSLQAEFYDETGRYKNAISVLTPIRGTKGYNEGHDYFLASLYEKDQQYLKSQEIVREVIQKNPQNAHALNFLGYSLLERGQDMDEAFELISRAVKLRPNDGFIRDSLGWYYFKQGDYKRALKEVKKAWELVREDVIISKHLAEIYQKLNRFDDAKKYFLEALRHCKIETQRQELMEAVEDLERRRLPASGQ